MEPQEQQLKLQQFEEALLNGHKDNYEAAEHIMGELFDAGFPLLASQLLARIDLEKSLDAEAEQDNSVLAWERYQSYKLA